MCVRVFGRGSSIGAVEEEEEGMNGKRRGLGGGGDA